MTAAYSASEHRAGAITHLTVSGPVTEQTAVELTRLIDRVLVTGYVTEVIVSLDAVELLDDSGIWALIHGYASAAEHGVTYRVVNAHGQPRYALRSAGIDDVLADSRDIGALLLALLTLPPRRVPRRRH